MEDSTFRFVAIPSTISSWYIFPMGCRSTSMTPGSELAWIAQGPSSVPIRAQPGALRLHTIQQAIRFVAFYQSACSRRGTPPMPPLFQVCSANEHPLLPRPTNPSQLALRNGSKRRGQFPHLHFLLSRNHAPPLSQSFCQFTTKIWDQVRDIVV